MTRVVTEARAVRHFKMEPEREFLTGRVLGHKRKEAIRLQIKFGFETFLSTREYASFESASASAKRFTSRLNTED